jgi:hypothetical protein
MRNPETHPLFNGLPTSQYFAWCSKIQEISMHALHESPPFPEPGPRSQHKSIQKLRPLLRPFHQKATDHVGGSLFQAPFAYFMPRICR